MKKLILIGGGGFAKEVDEIATLNGHDVIAYVAQEKGILDRPYWGQLETLVERKDEFDAVFIAFGSIDRKSILRRSSIVKWLKDNAMKSINLISPMAHIAARTEIDDGVFIAHGATISIDATIKAHAIINSNAIIGHDVIVGQNTTIAPGAFLGGMSNIGQDCLIGPGALILEGRQIGDASIVAIGASVVRNIPAQSTVMPLRSKVRH